MQSENVNIPGGSIQMNTRKFNVKTSGEYKNINEIKNTIVYSANGKTVYLKDIAEVESNYQDEVHLTRLNGYRAVLLTAAQKEGQNCYWWIDTTCYRGQSSLLTACFSVDRWSYQFNIVIKISNTSDV